MKEKFDDRLSNKIKNLFDNYQEDYQEDNWLTLKARIEKKKRKKIIVVWRQSLKVAAILIPLSLLAGWYLITLDFKSDAIKIAEKKLTDEDITEALTEQPPKDKSLSNSDNTQSHHEIPEQENLSTNSISSETVMKKNKKNITIPNDDDTNSPLNKIKKNIQKKNLDNTNKIAGVNPNRENNQHREVQFINPINKQEGLILNLDKVAFQEKTFVQMNDALSNYFTLDNPLFNNSLIPEKIKHSNKNKVTYGLGLTSLYNYTDDMNSSSSFNYGGSLMTDIPIVKNFSISSGLLLSKQSFILEDPILFTPSVTLTGTQNFQETDINLVALDIPINLSYNFELAGEKSLNLTAGVSSLVYLKESFTTNFTLTTTEVQFNTTTSMPETVTTIEQFQDIDEPQALNKFDFARLLNFSVGFSYPISSRFNIQFEPYIKYPIGELTNRNLKFGMGGIQLKLRFK